MTRSAAFVGIALGLILSIVGSQEMIADGFYPLSVSVRVTDPRPVRQATCCVCNTEAYAQEFIEQGIHSSYPSNRIAVDNPFTGGAMKVDVPFSFHSSWFGMSGTSSQFKALLVIVDYQDGRRESKVVSISDRRQTKSLSVTVP